MVASTGWGRGKQGLLFNQDRGAAGKDGKVQQMDGGEGCTTMGICFIPLKYTLKMVKTVNFML